MVATIMTRVSVATIDSPEVIREVWILEAVAIDNNVALHASATCRHTCSGIRQNRVFRS